GAHLLGTVNRWREAPLAGGVFRPTRRGREEVHRVVVGVALLDVGGVVGDRVGVVVVDVFVDVFVDGGGLGLEVGGGLGLEVVDGFGLEVVDGFGLEVVDGFGLGGGLGREAVDGFGFDVVVVDDAVRRRRHGLIGDHRDGSRGGGLGFVDFVRVLVPDERDLTGQLGDRDGVAVATAPPAPAADGRGTDRAVPRQQLRDRDRSCAAVAVV